MPVENKDYQRLARLLDDTMSIKSHELTPLELTFLQRVRDKGVWSISPEDLTQLEKLFATKGHLK